MANPWDNAPIVRPAGSPQQPAGGAMPWDNAPIVRPAGGSPQAAPQAPGITITPADIGALMRPAAPSAPAGSGAQQRYDEALENIRRTQFPDMSDEAWQHYSQAAFAPYGLTDLSQHGALFGLTDEIGSAMGALGSQLRGGPGLGETFGNYEALEQARRDLGREQQGALGNTAELIGGLAVGGRAPVNGSVLGATPAAFTPAVVPVANRVATGALTSGLHGATYGFGATDGDLADRGMGAIVGGGTGAVTGAAIPWVTNAILKRQAAAGQKAVVNQAVETAPSADAIKAASKAGYKASESTGAVIDMPALGALQKDMRTMLQGEGIFAPNGQMSSAYPKVSAAIRQVGDYASGPIDMVQAQALRKALRGVAKSTDPEEARIGGLMLNQFDDFIENLPQRAYAVPPNQGDPGAMWKKARADYARSKHVEDIEDLVSRAELSKQGFASGLEAEFRKILFSTKKQAKYSAEELDAMRAFLNGGKVEAVLQKLTSGSPLMSGMAGSMAGGPVGAALGTVGVPMVSALLRRSANKGAQRTIAEMRAAAALPGGLPSLPPFNPNVSGVAEALLKRGQKGLLPANDDKREALIRALMAL